MKFKHSRYFVFSFMAFYMLCLGCDFAELKFTLINKTDRTLTMYKPIKLPLSNADIYNTFKPSGANGTHIRFNFIVKPFTKQDDFSMYAFASQFKTTDGKLHLIILDVDSLKLLAQQHLLDSNSINRAILKHLVYSKEELEKSKKNIVYKE